MRWTWKPPSIIRSSLTREFLGVVVGAIVVVVAVHLFFMTSNRMLLRGKLDDCQRVGAIVAAIIYMEMREDAPHRVQYHLDEIPLGEDLVAIRVFDHTGVLVYAVGDDDVGRRVHMSTDVLCAECHSGRKPPLSALSTRSADGAPRFRVDIPIANSQECVRCHADCGPVIGNLLIETAFTPVELEQIRGRNSVVLAGSVIMLLAVVLLGVLLEVRILGPLRDLYRGVQRAHVHGADIRVRVRRADEIGFLAHSFNETMATSRRHQGELEEKVAARTAELEQSRLELIHRENLAALGRLAAGMAHEIGNPLSAISTLCQFVARRRREDGFVSEQLGLIEGHVRRLSGLSTQMMDLARPTPAVKTPVDINDAVSAASKLARMDHRLLRREVVVDLAPNLPAIPTQRDIVIQAVMNLVLNAADASPPDAPITVTTVRDDRRVLIRVRDFGGGVPPELERVIFEPFFTTKSPGRGNGLGLSVSLGLLRSVGASLQLRNDPGRGATFEISLDSTGKGEARVPDPDR